MEEINKNYIKNISIQGFRGFKTNQKIKFAYTNDKCNSGLNIIVGQNCSGKSTILEAIMLLMNTTSNGYFLSKTMKDSDIELNIKMESIKCKTILKTDNKRYHAKIEVISESSEDQNQFMEDKNYFLVPSRKNVNNNNLYNNNQNIEDFLFNYNNNNNQTINRRQNNMNNEFVSILTTIYADEKKKNEFDKILHEFLGDVSWNLHMSDEQQNSFVVDIIDKCGETHFEGVGDGLITIIYISVGLFLLKENLVSVLLIDEPEVSLHTDIIKRIKEVLREYSKEYQIIISTHSPYLIDWESIKNGGKLIRAVNENEISIYELDNSILNSLTMNPSNNPHVYGTTAKEVFFLKDKVILVEGQEDIICYRKIIKELDIKRKYNFYGWGVGGVHNTINIMKMLKSLGYKQVVAIFDGDDTSMEEAKKCRKWIEDSGSKYEIFNIKEQDVRDKYIDIYDEETLEKKDNIRIKEGICDKDYKIKKNFDTKYKDEMIELFNNIDTYFEE